MNNVVLSGGDLGGTIVIWPDGQTELEIEGFIYQLVSEGQAVFVGVNQD